MGANPAIQIGLTAINGSANTLLRSDGAPALDPSISPTWTGSHTFSGTVVHNGLTTFNAGLVGSTATGASQGAGTVNALGVYVNGVALANAVAANPTGTVGLTNVAGTATTFMRSDAAPRLSQAIVPTWTGAHTWSAAATFNAGVTVTPATSSVALTVGGAANSYAAQITANTTSGKSFGLQVTGGGAPARQTTL